MKSTSWFGIAALALSAVLCTGCGRDQTKKAGGGPSSGVTTTDDHSGWWCGDHGVPEEICSICSAKCRKECKEKGDWCEEHGVAKSQCFKCDPSLKEKFAAMYRAQFPGQEPPSMKE